MCCFLGQGCSKCCDLGGGRQSQGSVTAELQPHAHCLTGSPHPCPNCADPPPVGRADGKMEGFCQAHQFWLFFLNLLSKFPILGQEEPASQLPHFMSQCCCGSGAVRVGCCPVPWGGCAQLGAQLSSLEDTAGVGAAMLGADVLLPSQSKRWRWRTTTWLGRGASSWRAPG